MTLTHVTVLALIQGLTEFLPVSSSAHLILPSKLLGWPDQGLGFDVAVHVGTLLAVICYYLADLVKITAYTIESMVTRRMGPVAKIGFCLILATIPAAVFGFAFEQQISTIARSVELIAWTTIGYGILLGISSYVNRHLVWRNILAIEGERADSLRHLSFQQALIIGFAQALSIVPGTSRSGITLTAGLFLGMRPEAAARFSFLLSIPVIIASATLEGIKLIEHPELMGCAWTDMLLGAAIAFFTALLVIHFFVKFIAKSGMAVFVVYRVLLGAALLAWFC